MRHLIPAIALYILCNSAAPVLAQQQEPSLGEMMSTLQQVADSYPPKLGSETQRSEVLRLWQRVESGLLATLEQKAAREADVELLLGELYRIGHNLDIEDSGTKAIAHLQKAIDLEPTNAKPYLLLGRHQTFSGDFAGGELSLLRAYLLSPSEAEVDLIFLLAHNYYFQQRFGLVVHLADQFPKVHPGSESIAFLRKHAQQALTTGKAPQIIELNRDKPNTKPR